MTEYYSMSLVYTAQPGEEARWQIAPPEVHDERPSCITAEHLEAAHALLRGWLPKWQVIDDEPDDWKEMP